jgi:hypothetical protein
VTSALSVASIVAALAVALALWAQLWARGALCGNEYTPELEVWSPRDRTCSSSIIDLVSFGLLGLVPAVFVICLWLRMRPS